MGARFLDRASLLSRHSSALYFSTTLPPPFRSAELAMALYKQGGSQLRRGVSPTWGHLRYCPMCADEECAANYFSWWHRDHQLPLSSICVRHQCGLYDIGLQNLALQLPHEHLRRFVRGRGINRAPTSIEITIAKYEQYLATGARLYWLQRRTASALARIKKKSGSEDVFDTQTHACSAAMALLKELARFGVREPVDDWSRCEALLKQVVRDGPVFSDPAIAIILAASIFSCH